MWEWGTGDKHSKDRVLSHLVDLAQTQHFSVFVCVLAFLTICLCGWRRQLWWQTVNMCVKLQISVRMRAVSRPPEPLLTLLANGNLWTFTFDLWFLLAHSCSPQTCKQPICSDHEMTLLFTSTNILFTTASKSWSHQYFHSNNCEKEVIYSQICS